MVKYLMFGNGRVIDRLNMVCNNKVDTLVDMQKQGNTLRNSRLQGGSYGIKIHDAATTSVISNVTSSEHNDYGLYVAKGTTADWNDDIQIYDSTFILQHSGQHCWRMYWASNVHSRNCTLIQTSGYDGATGNFKHCRAHLHENLHAQGQPVGIGPDPTNKGENSYFCEEMTFTNVNWDFTTQIMFWPNVRKVTIDGGKIKVAKNSIFSISGPKLGRPIATEVVVKNLETYGGPGVQFKSGDWAAAKSKVVGCWFNNKKVA